MNVNPYHGGRAPIDDQLASLHKEMTTLRVHCDRLINKHLLVESNLNQSGAVCHNPDTSSAYNTGGESCRSTSITPEGQYSPCERATLTTVSRSPRLLHRSLPIPSPQLSQRTEPRAIDLGTAPLIRHKTKPDLDIADPSSLAASIDSCSLKTPGYCDPPAPRPLSKKFTPLRLLPSKESTAEFSKRFRIPAFSIVLRDPSRQSPSTSKQSIPKPKFFRSVKPKETLYMFDRPVDEITEFSDDDGEIAGPSERAPDNERTKDEPVQFKWKVKRRCDGSRYVVRRPLRSQLLKKREAQLIRERTGFSTDDDAMSELKLGHFHTREERKRHLEKERLRKEKQQIQKMAEANEVVEETIVQLSQRKMQKKKEKMLLDGFVTTQEVLSQRNNTSIAGKHGILSVTTV